MGIDCPACRKADQADATCTRCGCELTLLHQVVEAAESRLDAARRALAERDYPRALREAQRSWDLYHTQESAGLAFLAAAAAGQTAPALRWRRLSTA